CSLAPVVVTGARLALALGWDQHGALLVPAWSFSTRQGTPVVRVAVVPRLLVPPTGGGSPPGTVAPTAAPGKPGTGGAGSTRPADTLPAVRSLSSARLPVDGSVPTRTWADRHTRTWLDGSVCSMYADCPAGAARTLGTAPVGGAWVWSSVTLVTGLQPARPPVKLSEKYVVGPLATVTGPDCAGGS